MLQKLNAFLNRPTRVDRVITGCMLTFVMTVLALLSKFWAGKYSSELFGFSKSEGNIVGAGMVSRGEVALIVAQIGINHHLFPEDIYSSLILVIIVTTVISPFILNYYIKKQNTVTE